MMIPFPGSNLPLCVTQEYHKLDVGPKGRNDPRLTVMRLG